MLAGVKKAFVMLKIIICTVPAAFSTEIQAAEPSGQTRLDVTRKGSL